MNINRKKKVLSIVAAVLTFSLLILLFSHKLTFFAVTGLLIIAVAIGVWIHFDKSLRKDSNKIVKWIGEEDEEENGNNSEYNKEVNIGHSADVECSSLENNIAD